MKVRVTEAHLASPEGRRALPGRSSIYWLPLRRGLALGYRQGTTEGTWVVKCVEGGERTADRHQVTLGLADDQDKADGSRVLDFEMARAKAKVWEPKVDAPEATFRGTLARPATVRNAVLAYLTWLEEQQKSTRKAYSMANCHILQDPLAEIRLQDLTYTQVEDWRNKIANSPRRNRRRNPDPRPADTPGDREQADRARQATANRVLAFLKAALNRVQEMGHGNHDPLWDRIDDSAWRKVKFYPDVYRARQRFLTVEEQQALVAECPEGLKQLVQGALATGARFGELAVMRAKDVYLNSSTIKLATSRTHTPREIPILKEAKRFFEKLLEGKASGDWLFTREDGEPWGTNHYARPLQFAVARAGLEPAIFYTFRHTYASTMIMAGVTPAAVARALGHRNATMVLRTYGHLRANWATQEILKKAPRLGIFQTNGKDVGNHLLDQPSQGTPRT